MNSSVILPDCSARSVYSLAFRNGQVSVALVPNTEGLLVSNSGPSGLRNLLYFGSKSMLPGCRTPLP